MFLVFGDTHWTLHLGQFHIHPCFGLLYALFYTAQGLGKLLQLGDVIGTQLLLGAREIFLNKIEDTLLLFQPCPFGFGIGTHVTKQSFKYITRSVYHG